MERSPTHDIPGLDRGRLMSLIPVPICPDHHVAADLGVLHVAMCLLAQEDGKRPASPEVLAVDAFPASDEGHDRDVHQVRGDDDESGVLREDDADSRRSARS